MLLRQHKDFPSSSDHEIQSCIHYVETVPSVLQDMARVHQVKHKVSVLNRISPSLYVCVCVLYTIDLHSLVCFITCLFYHAAFRCSKLEEGSPEHLPSASSSRKGIKMCRNSLWSSRSVTYICA